MEKGTKEQILDAALDFFSVQGFEATSISQLADAVGIRKASLYSHFANKQDILDTITDGILKQYNQHSVFAAANWDDPAFTARLAGMNAERLVMQTVGQLRYIIHDPVVSKGRKMLVIEQFVNPELGKMQSKQNYDDVMSYHTGLFRYLTAQGILREEDPEVMAAQFCLPISVWLNLCDRDPAREPEAMALVEKHIRQFWKLYEK